jgi:hypothetical protein
MWEEKRSGLQNDYEEASAWQTFAMFLLLTSRRPRLLQRNPIMYLPSFRLIHRIESHHPLTYFTVTVARNTSLAIVFIVNCARISTFAKIARNQTSTSTTTLKSFRRIRNMKNELKSIACMYGIELEAVVKVLSSRLGIISLHFKLIKVCRDH